MVDGIDSRDREEIDAQLDAILRADEIRAERKRERLEQVRQMQMRSQA